MRALDDFDTGRNALYDDVAETVSQGILISPERTTEWAVQIHGISRRFAAVGEAVFRGGESRRNQKRILAALLESDDSERVSVFQDLVSDGDPGAEEVFPALSLGSAMRRVKEAFAMSDGDAAVFGDRLAEHYRSISAPDVALLASDINERYGQAMAAQQMPDSDNKYIDIYIDRDMLKKIAGSAAKLAMGAAIGLVWARRHRFGRDG